jgi:hypothetical protein
MPEKIMTDKLTADTDKFDLPAGRKSLNELRWTDDVPPRLVFQPATFERLIEAIVRDHAPRRFAVVQELRDCEDGRVAAWGLATDDDAFDLIDSETGHHITLHDLDVALRLYTQLPDINTRVHWIDPPRPCDTEE